MVMKRTRSTMKKIVIILAIVEVTYSFTTRHSIPLSFRVHIHPNIDQPKRNGKIQSYNSFGPLGRRRILNTRIDSQPPLYMAGKSSSGSGYNLDLPSPEETLRRERELREIEERIKAVDNRRLQIMQEILSEAESARDLVEKKKVTKGEIVDKETAELTALECEILELQKAEDDAQQAAEEASKAAEKMQLEAQQARAAEDAKKALQIEAEKAAQAQQAAEDAKKAAAAAAERQLQIEAKQAAEDAKKAAAAAEKQLQIEAKQAAQQAAEEAKKAAAAERQLQIEAKQAAKQAADDAKKAAAAERQLQIEAEKAAQQAEEDAKKVAAAERRLQIEAEKAAQQAADDAKKAAAAEDAKKAAAAKRQLQLEAEQAARQAAEDAKKAAEVERQLQIEAEQAARQAAEDAKKAAAAARQLQIEAEQAAQKLQNENRKALEKIDIRKDRDISLDSSSLSEIARPASLFGGFLVAAVTARSMLQNREVKQEELREEMESRGRASKNVSSIIGKEPVDPIGPIESQALADSSQNVFVESKQESNQSEMEFDVLSEGEAKDIQKANNYLIEADSINENAVESAMIKADIKDKEIMNNDLSAADTVNEDAVESAIIKVDSIDEETMMRGMITKEVVNEEVVEDSIVEEFEKESKVSVASIQEIASFDERDDINESIQAETEPMNGVKDERSSINQEESKTLNIIDDAYAVEEEEENVIVNPSLIDVPVENNAVSEDINVAVPENIDYINQVKGSANTSSLFSRNVDYESAIEVEEKEEDDYFDPSSFESVDINTLGHTPTIKVIGVGDGGNFAIEHMLKFHDPASEDERIDFWALNSDSQSLGRLMRKGMNTLIIGSRTAGGLGAGGDPSVGKLAADESREDIAKVVSGADVCFITGALGSGTGSGATPVISKIAKEKGALTLAIVTTPFPFEGKKRARRAREAIEALQVTADSVVLIMNRNLLEIIPNNMSLEASFRVADEMLRRGVEGISDMIKSPGLLVVDHLDLRGVLIDSGVAAMGIGTGRGKQAARDAAMAAITSPLLVAPVSEANKIVLNIVGGESLTLQKVNEAARIICGNVYEDANIIVGAQVNLDFPRDKITVTVIAAGFQDTE